MGLIDKVFGRRRPANEGKGYFQTFTAYAPQFVNWPGRIYESDLVRAAVDAKARHVAKLQYRQTGSAHRKLANAMAAAPNPWQTWSQFLERCSNIYEVQNNLFIIPILDGMGDCTGFYPVVPSDCDVADVNGEPYLRFRFVNGERRAMELSRCGIVAKHQLKDDFFGEQNTALNSTMELINMINQGIKEGVKSAASFRFMAKTTTHMFDEDIAKERKRFDRLNFSGGGGGLLLFDNRFTDIKELEPHQYKVDPEQMENIRTNVFNYFGVNEDVIQNKADGTGLDAFYNGCIETFAIKLSEAMMRAAGYTDRERNTGNAIVMTADRLQYMNVSAKVAMARELGDRGVLMIDEIRALFNYAPLPDGAGKHAPIRGEYYMVDEGRHEDEELHKKDGEYTDE